MSVAAIYDIHGNLPALEAVVPEIRQAGADQLVVGGDIVPGPMPRECIDVLRGLDMPVKFIRGNGDRVVADLMRGQEPTEVPPPYRDVIRWNAEQLTPEDDAWIATWFETFRVHIDGIGDVLFCHATPRNDWEIFTRVTPEELLRPIFEPVNAALVVCGHSHMQFDRRVGGTRVVNAGAASECRLARPAPTGFCSVPTSSFGTRITTSAWPRNAFAIRAIPKPKISPRATCSSPQPRKQC